MSKIATVSASVLITGQGRSQYLNIGPVTNATSPGIIDAQTLTQGDNLQTSSVAPVAQIGVLISPRAGQGYSLGLRHANTETIIPIDDNYPSFIPVDPGGNTTWLLNSTSAGVVDVVTV